MTADALRDRRVLVTGAGGCVGRAARAALEGLGARVLAPRRDEVDLAAAGAAAQLRARLGTVEAVVHLAAAVPNRPERPDDETTAALTRRIDDSIADAVAAWQCPLVYASGTSVYDARDEGWKDESAPTAARSPYLGAKLDGEARLGALDRCCIARLSGPCGPGLRATTVLGRFVALARAGRVLEVWGSGTREQDFVDVRDVASFACLALARGLTGIFNVARGAPTTMRALAEAVAARFGGRVAMVPRVDPQDGCTARFRIERAVAAGWTPRHDLDAMLAALEGSALEGTDPES